MRFCLLGPTHPFRGGIAHYNTMLWRALSRRHEVAFVSMRRQYPDFLFPGTTQHDASRDALRVDDEPRLVPLSPASWKRTARRVIELEPDLAIIPWWHPFFGPCFGSVADRLARAGVPTCFLCHNGKAHESGLLDAWLTRRAFRSVDRFVAHSEQDAAAIRAVRPRADVRVSPHPTYDCFRADESRPPAALRSELGLAERPTLLFFGYVRRYKGLPVLLRAMPKILERHDCQLAVVGEFYHEEEETRALVRELGLESSVRIESRYVPNEEVSAWFGAADAVVLPYRSASQSGIVQIAYGFDKPVVATRVGGLPEVITEGRTGFLADPEDPDSLADAVERYFRSDRSLLAEAIRRGRDRFSWDRMVETLEGVARVEEPLPSETTAPGRKAPAATAPAATLRDVRTTLSGSGPTRVRTPSS